MNVTALIVAKAPVPGLAKTRLAATLGNDAAADIAAAALLDTLDAVSDADVVHRVVALTGDLDAASRSAELKRALASYIVVRQRGDGFAERLMHAHADAASGHPVLQIGMDTPQVTGRLLNSAAEKLCETGQSVLGMAEDGGWWALGVAEPSLAQALLNVPMSTAETGAVTVAALQSRGTQVHLLPPLRDVDYVTDLHPVAELCSPSSRFVESVTRHTGRLR